MVVVACRVFFGVCLCFCCCCKRDVMAGSINFGNNGAPFWFMQANISTYAHIVMCLFCAFSFLHFVVIATVQAKR